MKYHPFTSVVFRFSGYTIPIILKACKDNSFFYNIISETRFKEAIFFASPSFFKEYEKFLSNKKTKKDDERMKMSLIKYLSRMSTRCTPFGKFASCAVGNIGNGSNLIVETDKDIFHFRYDMLFVSSLYHYAYNNDIVFKKRFIINSTIYKCGGKIRYISCVDTFANRKYIVKEVKFSALLKFIIKHANEYIYYRNLKDIIMSKFTVEEKDIDLYLKKLIVEKILISEIEPNIIGVDYFTRLCSLLENNSNDIADYVNELKKYIHKLNLATSFGDRKSLCDSIYSLISNHKKQFDIKYVFQLDTINKSSKIQLSSGIIKQIEDCLSLLNKITPKTNNHSLNMFKSKFIERYGSQEIPLLEALDSDVGIGYIGQQASIDTPLVDHLVLPNKANTFIYTKNPLYELLKRKLNTCKMLHQIEITDEDVAELEEDYCDLPVTIAAKFKIVGYNLKEDKYKLSELCFFGSSAANLLGRFVYCDEKIKRIVADIAKMEQNAYANSIIAEISHLPDFRTGNIQYRPSMRDYEIDYYTPTDGKMQRIPISDIYVTVQSSGIVLKSKRFNMVIIPRLTTAHNFHNGTTSIYRFLCDLQSQDMRNSLCFSWGVFENILTHFPRVIYKKIVLSPEKWVINKKDISNNKGIVDYLKMRKFFQKLDMPQYIKLMIGDNELFIDLDSDLSLKMLAKEILKYDVFSLAEYIMPEKVSVVDEYGDNFANECIVPLVRKNK